MYYKIVSQCADSLRAVETWLDKAEAFAASKRFEVQVLMDARLAPDMGTFVYQVQSACDYVKGAAALLSGQTPPRHDDFERSIDEVRARIRKTLAFADSVPEAAFEAASTQPTHWARRPIGAEDYLLQIAVPNVYFHLMAAYAILRANGVPVGKMDFLGKVRFTD